MLPLSDEIIIKNSTDMNAICRREMKKEAEKRRFATSFSMQKCLENCKIGLIMSSYKKSEIRKKLILLTMYEKSINLLLQY